MPALALAVRRIALPDSLNPTLIDGDLYEALTARRFRRTLAFTLAASLVTLAGGLVLAVGLGDPIVPSAPKLTRTVNWAVLTAVGAALVGGSAALWWRRSSVAESQPPSERASAERSDREGSPLVIAAGIAGVEFLTAFPHFAAIATVTGASVSLTGKVLKVLRMRIVTGLRLPRWRTFVGHRATA